MSIDDKVEAKLAAKKLSVEDNGEAYMNAQAQKAANELKAFAVQVARKYDLEADTQIQKRDGEVAVNISLTVG